MTVRVERWGGIIDDDRDRYVTWVPAQNRPIVRIRDRPRYRRSCSRDVLWLLNAQREGKVGISVEFKLTATVEQSSTLHNSPSSSVQQRAVILRAVIFFIVTHCNMAQVYSTCLRYAYVLLCVCLACSSLACVKLCLGSERENPRECFALESVGSNPTHSTSPFQFPSLLSFLTCSIFTKRYLVGFVFQIAENIRVVKPIFPPSSRVHFRASLRFLGS